MDGLTACHGNASYIYVAEAYENYNYSAEGAEEHFLSLLSTHFEEACSMIKEDGLDISKPPARELIKFYLLNLIEGLCPPKVLVQYG